MVGRRVSNVSNREARSYLSLLGEDAAPCGDHGEAATLDEGVPSKSRHDVRERRARAVFAGLRGRADMNEAGKPFVRLQSKPREHIAIECEPASQPVRAVTE